MRGIKKICSNKRQIINIVRRSLSYIDERLIEHGERVAFIADAIAEKNNCDVDRETLFVLALLHDIGAYKTEEIDNMVHFETQGVSNHAIYGYVFLKNATYLGETAEAILYHHTDFLELEKKECAFKNYAEIIFLADRIDILLLDKDFNKNELIKLSGTTFSPEYVRLFLEADKDNGISNRVKDLSYINYVEERINNINLTDDEVMGFLKMLVYSIDFRSPFTVTHTANTTAVSAFLAEKLNLSEKERNDVRLGAFLHDIGKLAIPYSILESPGKLTKEEMDIMRTHVKESESILRGIVSDDVCEIAIRHHEKLNGKGYFRGLKDEDLTVAQRIVAIADIVSALINRRSYKEGFPKEKTISILKEMSDNGEICPIVSDIAIQNFDEIIEFSTYADDPIIKLYESIINQYKQLSERSNNGEI